MPTAEKTTRSTGDLIGSYTFAYLLTFALVGLPILIAGPWDVLAWTRLLDPLVDLGIIRYQDGAIGMIKGLDDIKHYVEAQEPIHWWLVATCAGVYLAFNLIKAVQFHQIARLYGMKGTFGHHARAFFYGQGLNRVLPFATGDVAIASALEGQGESRKAASTAVYIQDRFVDFEVFFFFATALTFAGWTAAIQEVFWSVVFVTVLWLVMRSAMPKREKGLESPLVQFLRAMAGQPAALIGLCALSLLAFFLDELTPYFVAQAFSSDLISLNTDLIVIHGGVVAGYIAMRIPVTPGGIGQFELGFGTGLVAGGVDMPVAITIAVLSGLVRHGIGLFLFVIVRVGFGIETTSPKIIAKLLGTEESEAVPAGAGS